MGVVGQFEFSPIDGSLENGGCRAHSERMDPKLRTLIVLLIVLVPLYAGYYCLKRAVKESSEQKPYRIWSLGGAVCMGVAVALMYFYL